MTFSRIALIYNPHSGRPRERQTSVERFASLLRQAGKDVLICPTQRCGHATDLAREAVARGCDLVVANGGDGTMNEVLQAVVGTEATLGFWPGGTANVLAHEIRFPSNREQVVKRILRGQTERVTVGKANDRYFLLMAGIGLDAAVSAAVDPQLKRHLGKGAFAIAALKFIHEWNLLPVRVHLPGGEELIARFVVVGNAHSYGGGFQLTPSAALTDPHLDVCIIQSQDRLDYLNFALASVRGWHVHMPGVTYRKVGRLSITSAASQDAPVQLDGEVTGCLPLTLEAIPEAVKLLV
jgi:diacylglycerol kinase (ATP)